MYKEGMPLEEILEIGVPQDRIERMKKQATIQNVRVMMPIPRTNFGNFFALSEKWLAREFIRMKIPRREPLKRKTGSLIFFRNIGGPIFLLRDSKISTQLSQPFGSPV